MRVIVTGGTGFIGKALIDALLARGHEVAVLTRRPAAAPGALPPQVQILEWHPPQPGPWADAFNGADGVVNLAGEPLVGKRWTEEQKRRVLASRVDPTNALVEAITRADPRPRTLVNQSAIGYYGSPGDTPVTEASPPGQDFPAYVVEQWEAAARRVELSGVRLVVLRTGIVLGAGGGALPPMVLPFRMFAGGTLGDPGQWFSWIHLDDEIEVIIRALTDEGMRGVYNATAPNPVTMDRFSRQIGEAIGRPSWVPMYGTMMRLALGRERGEAVLASQRVLPAALEKLGYTFRHTDSGEALRSILSR